jgi:hypothetical protein
LAGIRNVGFDRYGISQAIDENAGSHIATRISLANQSSPETGQFSYDLRPGLRVPLTVTFDNFNRDFKDLYSVEIRGSDGAPIAVSFRNLPLSGTTEAVKGVIDIHGISYEVNSCTVGGSGLLSCHGSITNTREQNRKIMLISKQLRGIRNVGLDALGTTKAIDANASEYAATAIRLANHDSPETGQFLYELLPHLRVPLVISFNNFDRSAKSLYTLEIHGTDGQPVKAVFPGVPVLSESSQSNGGKR